MTAAELIAELQKLPADTVVAVQTSFRPHPSMLAFQKSYVCKYAERVELDGAGVRIVGNQPDDR